MDVKANLADSKVFCIAPWAHLHVVTDGQIFPCCMSGHDGRNAVGDLRAGDTLASAWNAPRMRTLRRNMLAGRPSRLCERCYVNENLGIASFRTTENTQMAHHLHWAQRTNSDGGLDTLHVPYLDLRVSNLCNLKCRICSHKYSTSWYDDAVRLGLLAQDGPRQIEAAAEPDHLWRQIQPLIASLEHVHFAGGEPLIMPEHYRLLNELLTLGRTDVRVSYNTNFLVLHYRRFDVVSMWKRFRDVYVSASLDGMGPRGDYMRKGQRWDRIEANRARLLHTCPEVDFQVAATVSLMNVLHLPAFFRDWHQKGYVRPDRMKMYPLFEPEYYSVQGLPADVKRRVEDLYGEFVDTYLAPLGEPAAELVQNFRAIVSHMKERDLDIASEFRRVTTELDILRNESFPETFPELAHFATPTTVERGQARRRLSDLARHRRDYDEAIRLDPRNADAHAERASLQQQSGDSAGALAGFTVALEVDPGHPYARLNRAVLWRERGEHEAALSDLDVLLARGGTVAGRDDWERLVHGERGRTRLRCGDLIGALADFDRAVSFASPGDQALSGVLTERGSTRRRLGDSAGALSDFDAAIRLDPDELWAHVERGRMRRATDPLAALEDFTAALALARHSPRIPSEDRDRILAEVLVDKAELLVHRAAAQQALGNDIDALRDFDEAILLSPTAFLAHLGQARARRRLGDLAGASAAYDQAFTWSTPAYLPLILSERAVVKQALADHVGAWRDFAGAAELAPTSGLPFLNQAIAAVESGRLPKSDGIGASLDLAHPWTPALLHYARGVTRCRLGERDLARGDFDLALALLPGAEAQLRQLVDRARQREWDPAARNSSE